MPTLVSGIGSAVSAEKGIDRNASAPAQLASAKIVKTAGRTLLQKLRATEVAQSYALNIELNGTLPLLSMTALSTSVSAGSCFAGRSTAGSPATWASSNRNFDALIFTDARCLGGNALLRCWHANTSFAFANERLLKLGHDRVHQ